MNFATKSFVIVMAVALLGGCSRERQDWQSAQMADTVEAYEDFIAKHADSARATQARERVQQLQEERDWQRAATTDTLGAYQAFVQQYPGSRWTAEARIRIENFGLAQPANAPAGAPIAPPPTAAATLPTPAPAAATAAAPASAPVTAAPVPPPPAAATTASGYGVQLGAFGTEAQARAEWQRLARNNEALLKNLSPTIAPAQGKNGVLYRLRASTPGEAEARSLCAALSEKGNPCAVVLPLGR